jgi:hypothetical protein
VAAYVSHDRRIVRTLTETPSLLERLVIDRVVTCWLQVQYWDWLAAQSNDRTLRQREYLQRSQDRAQRRYLSAIRSLATVRRLLLPPVQVNIGNQQVNVAGAVTAHHRGDLRRQ